MIMFLIKIQKQSAFILEEYWMFHIFLLNSFNVFILLFFVLFAKIFFLLFSLIFGFCVRFVVLDAILNVT